MAENGSSSSDRVNNFLEDLFKKLYEYEEAILHDSPLDLSKTSNEIYEHIIMPAYHFESLEKMGRRATMETTNEDIDAKMWFLTLRKKVIEVACLLYLKGLGDIDLKKLVDGVDKWSGRYKED